MAKSNVVLCAPVRTAIGTYGGTLKGIAAPDLGAAVIKAALERAKLDGSDVDTVVMGHVVQAGAKMNPARQAARSRAARRGAGADRQPRLRLGRPGHRHRGAGGVARHARLRRRRRHGEHGPGAVPHGRRALGLPHGRRADLRQHAARRPERRVLRQAFRLAHRGSGHEVPASRREDQDRWALRSQQRFARRRRPASSTAEIVPSRCRPQGARRSSTRTSTIGPTPRPSRWPSSSPPSARTAPSPPAMRPVSTPARRR